MKKLCYACMRPFEGREGAPCPLCGKVVPPVPEVLLHLAPGTGLGEGIEDSPYGSRRYLVGRVLGYGSYGCTYIGIDLKFDRRVAIKEYLPSEFSTRAGDTTVLTVLEGDRAQQFADGLKTFRREAERLAAMRGSEGVVQVLDFFDENHTAYMVMELLEGQTLGQYLITHGGKLTFAQAWAIVEPAARALAQLGDNGIVHGDISPETIFITQKGHVKVTDFGAAKFATTSHSRSLSAVVTPGYSAVEQAFSGEQGTYTDVYALGAVLYRCITGIQPANAADRYSLLAEKGRGSVRDPSDYCSDISEDQENGLLNALNIRPENRTQDMETFLHDMTSGKPVKRIPEAKLRRSRLHWPLWARVTVPAIAGVLVLFGVLLGTGVIAPEHLIAPQQIVIPDGMSRVPSVVSEPLDSAEVRLEEAVLLYSIVGKEYSSLIPADFILTQSIDGGAVVTQNSIVELLVSGGIQTALVPNVTGLYADEAEETLAALGFLVRREEQHSDSVANGGVLSQSVEADTDAAVGSEIVLTVSIGPEHTGEETLVTVPDFTGKTYDEAQSAAAQAGLLLIARERVYSTDFPADTVMSQSIAAGTEILSGNTVELTVSLGTQRVRVPDVTFREEAAAKTAVEAAGLKAKISYQTSDTVRAGLVITQNPPAGTEKGPGDTVSLTVSSGSAAFSMPDVTGQSEDAARRTLSSRGISVEVGYERSAGQTGIVLRQSIAPGTSVKSGAAVTLTVSSGEELFTVPDVTGQSRKDAEAALKKLGFSVSVTEVYSDTAQQGTVTAQTPAAGTQQPAGTQTVLNVSKGKEPVTVPQVTGMKQETAQQTITQAGFTFRVSSAEYSSTVLAGAVISQTPASGDKAEKGSTVSVVVSKGKEPVNAQSVTLDHTELRLYATGNNTVAQLRATVLPNDATDKSLTWKSADPAIASVDASGQVQGLSAGETTVTVRTANGLTAACRVTVLARTMNGLTVSVPPAKTNYTAGDAFDPAGMKISVLFDSGETLELPVTADMCSPAQLMTPGTQTVTVSYGSRTATTSVTVAQAVIRSLSVQTMPNTVSYFEGDPIRMDGLVLRAQYSDGNVQTVTSGYSYDPQTASGDGAQTVSVTYDGMTVRFDIQVTALTGSMARGSCGNDLTWFYDGAGTLTVSGTGDMADYAADGAPWNGVRGEIRRIILNDGVTSVGSFAFYQCRAMTAVSIPGSVQTIRDSAFAECANLSSVLLEQGVTQIGAGAFQNCTSLMTISLPEGLTFIGDRAFSRACVMNVTVPASVTDARGAFADCRDLLSVTFLNSSCQIGDTETEIASAATIRGYTGSTAQQYAVKYGRHFESVT